MSKIYIFENVVPVYREHVGTSRKPLLLFIDLYVALFSGFNYYQFIAVIVGSMISLPHVQQNCKSNCN